MRARLAPRARRRAISVGGRRRARAAGSPRSRTRGAPEPTSPIRMSSERAYCAAAVVLALAAGVGGERRRLRHLAPAAASRPTAREPAVAGRVLKDRLEARPDLRGRRAGGNAPHDADPPVPGLGAVRRAVGLKARVVGEGHGDVGGLADLHRAFEAGRGHANMAMGTRLTCIVWPMTDGSLPKRRSH